MPEEGFLRRWSRLKATGGEAAETPPRASTPAPSAAAPVAPPATPRGEASENRAPPPTLDDVARLTPESDFSAFVAQGVDKSVHRLALKKLFADPHFRVMDGLDMYMDDYNKPSPMSAAMLAALEHAKSALRPSEPHTPQVAAHTAGASPAAASERTGADGADAIQAPEPRDEPETVAADAALPGDEAVRGSGAPLAVPEEADDVYAPSACIQTGPHPQSLQGQA